MKFSLLAVSALCGGLSTASAWTSPPSSDSSCSSRRQVLQQSLLGVTASLVVGTASPSPAVAGLLEDYGGTDTMKIESSSSSQTKKAAATIAPKSESNMEPNLRSNYYYPTNKKRYLPRIKKCNDAIPMAAEAIGTENWDYAEEFVTQVADDTILPMRLYTSSLLGGGTNVKVAFAKDMKQATDDFEKAQKKLVKSVGKKDRENSSVALEAMASALLSYGEAGRLTGPDGGGDIPSVDEIRRSACRVQGRRFEEKVKERDERLKQASTTSTVASSK